MADSKENKEHFSCMPDACPTLQDGDLCIFGGHIDDLQTAKPKLLLHVCCGPCSTSVIERLISSYDITVFYYNPNTHGEDEYEKRKETLKDFINKINESGIYDSKVAFLEGEYDPETFFERAKGLENEPEGGLRCTECFRLRLERTAVTAKTHGFDIFATSLTVSPYKNYSRITDIGNELAFKYGLSYLDIDFKKKDGYRRSVELSKAYGLYRQNYCGCIYSKRD